MFMTHELNERYPLLAKLADPLVSPTREVVGRAKEQQQLLACMSRPELCNALLVAEPGTGKTALVQATMQVDPERLYLEVDPARMIADAGDGDLMASKLKGVFDEAERFVADEKRELVLFIDEVHQIVQLSDAAVEAIKPKLAASGALGIRVIAATTYDEFHKHIAANLPLVERLQRINLNPPDQETTIKILIGMAARYGVADEFSGDHLFRQIYEYTNRYMPASSQPRKSILVLDGMVGWHKLTGRAMDRALLADVLQESLGVNISFQVDAVAIKRELDSRVLSQDLATSAVARRLQLSVADLHDPTRPMASLLFTGSTGVGKPLGDAMRVPVLQADGTAAWKCHGDLVAGSDRVFSRDGRPLVVQAHFKKGKRDTYRITLTDGRTIDAADNHDWSVYTAKQRSNLHAGQVVTPALLSTQEMVQRGVLRRHQDNRKYLKFFLPAAEAVQWPDRDLAVDPYVLGVLLGNGCLTLGPLTVSSSDADAAHTVQAVGDWLGAEVVKCDGNHSWQFVLDARPSGSSRKYHQTQDILKEYPELIGTKSPERRIPDAYRLGSIEQRWALVRGMFDTDGTIEATGSRFNVSYSTASEMLAQDLREVLFSLGVSSSLKCWDRVRDGVKLREYDLHIKVGQDEKPKFFSLPRKCATAERATRETQGRTRVKKFDMVGIKSIEKLPEQQSVSCIYVDDPEHLYQAGEFIVTHNTELTKQLARLLFGDDQRHLLRFDMTEFAQDESLSDFRTELTRAVWNQSHAVLLFDEVEKASSMVTRVLMQVLDDGRLTDEHGRVVSFLNCYVILTTNAGSEIYKTIAQYAEDKTGSGKLLEDYQKLIRRSISQTTEDNAFPVELLGRIDAIVPFQPLARETKQGIVQNKLLELVRNVFIKHSVWVDVDERVVNYIVEDKASDDSDGGGARDAVARLTDEVSTAVAAFINHSPSVRKLKVWVSGEMVSENKGALKSAAHIEVSAMG